MRSFIILAIIISFILAIPLTAISLQTSKANMEEVYQKQDTKIWGEIFSWVFNRKQFEKSYALVIGIGDYQKDWPKLEAPFYDALRVRDFLVNHAGFDYVVTLTNAKATKQSINKLMEETFPSLLHDNDRFLFYFSGHGTQRLIGKLPFGYLVLRNAGLESYGDMITMEDIKRWDSLLYPTRHVLFILDSCFSGLAGQQRKSPLTDKKLERLSQYSHYLITAGTADEESVASLQKWHGSLFTDSFLRAVSGHADLRSRDFEADGVVSLKELMKYVGDRIDDESVKLKSKSPLSKGIKMSPQISDLRENEGEFFFITKQIKNKKMGNVLDKELERGWPVVETKGESPSPSSLEDEKQRLAEKRALLERERLRLEQVKTDIERKKVEAERKRLEAEKEKIETAELSKPEGIAPDGTFIAYANGVVRDTKTGLEWITGPDKDMTWYEAKSWIKSLNIHKADWRMPMIHELKTLYKKGVGTHNMTSLLKTTGWWVWLGETDYPKWWAWRFNFSSGRKHEDWPIRLYKARAFAVRSRGDG